MTLPFDISGNTPAPGDPKKIWINRFLRLDRAYNAELHEFLLAAAEDAEKEIHTLYSKAGVGANVRRAQITGSSGVITAILHALFRDNGTLIEKYRGQAATESVKASNVWDKEVLKVLIPDSSKRKVFQTSLEATANRQVAAMVKRITSDPIPLSRKVYRSEALARRQVDRVVNSSLAKGDSAEDLGRKVRQFIDPKTPGGASFAARRLGRTEINNAYHAQAIESIQGRPWIAQAEWRLSGSHKPKPGDLCERYARTRLFSASGLPLKPHPQCLCVIVPVTPPLDWIIDQLEAGIYDQWLEDNSMPRPDAVLS